MGDMWRSPLKHRNFVITEFNYRMVRQGSSSLPARREFGLISEGRWSVCPESVLEQRACCMYNVTETRMFKILGAISG